MYDIFRFIFRKDTCRYDTSYDFKALIPYTFTDYCYRTLFIFISHSRLTILPLLTSAREDNFGPGSSVSTPLNITPHSLALWSLIEALPNAWCCCSCRPHWAVQLEIWGLPCPQSGFIPNRFFFRRISTINIWNWIQSSMIILNTISHAAGNRCIGHFLLLPLRFLLRCKSKSK